MAHSHVMDGGRGQMATQRTGRLGEAEIRIGEGV